MELYASILSGKAPVNRRMLTIAPLLIGSGVASESSNIRQATIETLTLQDTQFNLRHVEPTAMFRGEMKLQLAPNAARLCGGKRLVERGGLMGIELVEHQANHLRLGILLIDQPPHLVREVLHRPPVAHRHVPPAGLRLTKHKEIGRALARILIVRGGHLPGLRRQGLALLGNQLHAFLVKVDLGTARIVGLGIEVQHVFHTRHKLRAYLRNTPLLILPGLKGIFLRRPRTVSYESRSQSPNSTALSASNRSVHRLRSPGALLQATAIKCAWPLASSLGRWPGRGRSVRAPR